MVAINLLVMLLTVLLTLLAVTPERDFETSLETIWISLTTFFISSTVVEFTSISSIRFCSPVRTLIKSFNP